MIWLCGLALAAPLAGRVLERGTGDPIAGAEIQAGGRSIRTDGEGRFSLELPEGPVELRAESLEHLPLTMAVAVPEQGLKLYLEPAPAEVEVVVEARRDSPHVSRQVLDRERVEQTPGTHEDAFRLIQSLPGVSMTPEFAPNGGDVALRGSAPAESRIYVDGVEIPYLYHFQQYASVIHTRQLDEMAVYPSATSAEFGDSIGGAVDVRTRRVEGERLHGGASLTTILGGAHITAPLEGGWGLGASARRSYADLFESDSTQYTQWPVFWDYLGRADHQGAGGESSLLVFGAGDAHGRYIADLDFADPLEAESATAYSTDRAFHAAIWSRRWGGERWQHEGRLGLLWDSVENLAGASTEQVQALNLTAQQRSLWRPSTDFQLSLGLEARPSHLSYDVQTDRAWVELGAEAPLLARGTPVEEQLLVMRGGAWVEPRWQLGDWRLQPGLRLQGESAAGTFAVDPRLLLRWSAAEDLSLRGAVGRYSMAPSPEDVAIPGGAPELGLARSEEAALGMDWAVAGRWEIALDGWGRRVSGAVDADPGQTPTAEDGWAAGAELTSRYRIRERFFAWTGLTVGRAERDGHPADHDQPWALSAVASWDFAPRWGAGLRYRYAAGLPETPIASGRYLGDSDSYEAVLGAENSERLPRYQKIDLHVERELLMRGWTMTLFAEGWFVPAPNNYLYRIHSYDYSESALVRGPTFLPLLGGRAEF